MKLSRALLSVPVVALALATLTPFTLTSAGAAGNVAAPAVGTPAGYGSGYNNVIGTLGIFNHLMKIGSSTVHVYCLVQSAKYVDSGTYRAVAPPSSIQNLARAQYIAANSTKIGTPLATDPEATSVQAAIWNETSGFNYDTIPNYAIATRSGQLVINAVAPAPSTAPLGIGFHVIVHRRVGSYLTTIWVYNTTGQAVTGQSVVVRAPGFARRYVTGYTGIINLPALTRAGMLRLSATATLPAGTVMQSSVPGSQPLVTADPAVYTATASTRVGPSARPVPATTVPRPVSTTPAPVTTPAPSTIPAPVTPTTVRRHPAKRHPAKRPPVTTTSVPTTVIVPPTTPVTPTTIAPPAPVHSMSSTIWYVLIAALLILFVFVWRFRSARRQ